MLTEKQRETRRQGLGSSDAAPALGVSRFRSRYALWLEKTGLREPDPLDFWAIHRGNALEASLLRWYSHQFGVDVEESPDTLTHPEHPFLLAHLDGLATSGADSWIVEAKVSMGGARKWGEPGSSLVDPEYLWQAVHQMAVAGLPRVDFVVDFGWPEPQVFTVWRDLDLEDEVLAIEAEFWRLVEDVEPPEPDGSDECRKYLETIAGTPSTESRPATEEEEELALWLRDLQEAHREAGAEIDRIKNLLRLRMGRASRIFGEAFQITWKANKNGTRVFRPTFFEE